MFPSSLTQVPDSKSFHVKGKQHSGESFSSYSVQLPYDVPPSPYTKNGVLRFFRFAQYEEFS